MLGESDDSLGEVNQKEVWLRCRGSSRAQLAQQRVFGLGIV